MTDDIINDEQSMIEGNPAFEDALGQLENIVRQLESGEVPLEQSIALYQKGHVLREYCQKRLDDARAQIEKINIGPDGKAASTQSFDSE